MSVPLRVAACATAVALTLTPEMAGPQAAAAETAAEPTVVQIHRQDDRLRQLLQLRDLNRSRSRYRQELLRSKHARQLALQRLRQAVRRKQARMMAGYRARANRAVRFAYRQRGKPYRWGGTGPRGYDCSGLVQRAWRAGGVRIPRVTYGQYRMRPHISRHRLRPGDLVFFHALRHVGIYVGHTRFIHSPHTGSHVRVERLRGYYRSAFVGAVRPAWPHLPKLPTRLPVHRHHTAKHHKAPHHRAKPHKAHHRKAPHHRAQQHRHR